MIAFFVNNLTVIGQIKRVVKQVIKLAKTVFNGFAAVIGFIQFLLNSIGDLVDILDDSLAAFNVAAGFAPSFLTVFLLLFVLTTVIRVVLDVI